MTTLVKKRLAYGTALAWFRKNHAAHPDELDNAHELSRKSIAYLDLTKAINGGYLAYQVAEETKDWEDKWAVNEVGVLTKGPHRGRRILWIYGANKGQGSHFQPWESVDNTLPSDFAVISVLRKGTNPSQGQLGEVQAHYLGTLVHELAHAHNRIESSRVPLELDNYEQAIQAFIQDEVQARQKENKIIGEVLTVLTGITKRSVKTEEVLKRLTHRKSNNNVDVASVQRDFVEGEDKLTYLEMGVMLVLMERQVWSEGLSWSKIDRLNAYVKRLRLGKPLKNFLETEFPQDLTQDPNSKVVPGSAGGYVDLRLIRRVMQARWKEWKAAGSRASAKEKILQAHARAFFPSTITYEKP